MSVSWRSILHRRWLSVVFGALIAFDGAAASDADSGLEPVDEIELVHFQPAPPAGPDAVRPQPAGPEPLGPLGPPGPAAPSGPQFPEPPAPVAPSPSNNDDAANLVRSIAARVATTATESNPAANASVVQGTATSGGASGPAPTTTAELIDRVEGVNIRQVSQIYLDPRIRGFNTNQIGAVANGVPQWKTRIDIDTLFSQIPAGLIRDVTVFDGPYTSQYGPGFSFLVADLMPVRFYETPEWHGLHSFSQDTNSRTFYQRQTMWGGGSDWSVLTSFGLRTGSDYTSANGFQVPSQFQTWDGFFSVAHRLSELSRVEFSYLHPEFNNVELPGVAYDLANSTDSQFNVRYVIQESPDQPERVAIQAWYVYTGYHGNSNNPSKTQTGLQFRDQELLVNADGSLGGVGLNGKVTLGDADGTQLTLGASWTKQRISYTERDIFVIDPDTRETFEFLSGLPNSTIIDLGLFTAVNVPVTDNLSLAYGGRLDYYLASFRNAAVPAQDVQFFVGSNEPQKCLGMAYANAKYRYTDEISFTSGVGFAMRGPQIAELYSTRPFTPIMRFGNSEAYGNSGLSSEKLLQFDQGVKGRWDRFGIGVRGFYSNINDYILPIPVENFSNFNNSNSLGRTIRDGEFVANDGTLIYKYYNVSWASLYGGELTSDWTIVPGLTVSGGMAYVKGTNHDPKFYILNELTASFEQTGRKKSAEGLPGIYPWNGTLSVRVYEPDQQRWSLELYSRLVMSQRYVAQSLGEVPSTGYTTFNLRGYWQIRENVRLTATLQNLFNYQYTEIGSLAISNPSNDDVIFVPSQGFNALFGVDIQY